MRAKLKKWGNSLALIIPADVASREALKAGDEVDFNVKKCDDIMELFGKYKNELKHFDAQKMKDETREADAESDERLARTTAG
jgi:antitoxin component of MazEF toxin-antitoxin module